MHPSRYPKHDEKGKGPKGQIFGGECNITACERQPAVMYNIMTYGMYCRLCAANINYNPMAQPICIPVEAKPDRVKMDRLMQTYDFKKGN